MHRKSIVWALSAVAVAGIAVMAVAGVAWAEEASASKGVKIGSAVPNFELKDLDGNEHSLAEHKGKPVVLIFVSQHCPWVQGAQSQMNEVAKEYEAKGVVFYGIDSDAVNKVEDIRKYVEEKDVAYTVLKDLGNKFADALNAQNTPEVFIVDKDGNLAYHGAFDNRRRETQVGSENYVRMALDEILADKPVSVPEKRQWGCGIRRVK